VRLKRVYAGQDQPAKGELSAMEGKGPQSIFRAERVSRLSELIEPAESSADYPWEGLAVELFRADQPTAVRVSFEDYYLAAIREGTGVAWTPGAGRRREFAAGDVAIVPPGARHHAITRGPAAAISVYIKPSLVKRAAAISLDPGSIEIAPQLASGDRTLQALTLSLESELQNGLRPNRLFGEALGTALASHLLTRYAVKRAVVREYRGGMPRHLLRRTIDHMQSNLGMDLRLSELAENVQMSPWHFCRMFKQSTGVPPHQYLMRERIEAAKRMLVKSRSNLDAIAATLGFADQSHLIAVFRRLTGLTPRQFINRR